MVSASHRRRLEAIASDRNGQHKCVEPARVILASGGGPVQPIETRVGLSRPKLGRRQQQFTGKGVDGLLPKMRKHGSTAVGRRGTIRFPKLDS